MSIPYSNPQTFGWIKPVLFESMIKVKNSVNGAVLSKKPDALASAAKELHQIQGALQMTELGAASMFAEDLERLAESLDNRELTDLAERLDVLRRGVELLDKYIVSIDKKNPISPLAMVERINAVRKLTGKSVLSKIDLFDPPLRFDSVISGRINMSFPEDKKKNVLLHLQKRFRQSLLAWLGDNDPHGALESMKDLMLHLQNIGGPDVLQQLWWVAGGFIEAIQNGSIVTDAEVKAQLARLDVEINGMKESGDDQTDGSSPDNLLRHLLYLIGNAEYVIDDENADQSGEFRAQKIKESLQLDQWFIFDSDTVQENLYADLIDMVKEMSRAISYDDIALLEDQFDRRFSEQPGIEETEKFFENLDIFEQHLNSYNSGVISGFGKAMVAAARNVEIQPEVLLDTDADIKLASALLFFKQTLSDPQSINAGWMETANAYTEQMRQLADRTKAIKSDKSIFQQQSCGEYLAARETVVAELRNQLDEVETIISGIKEIEMQKILELPDIYKSMAKCFNILNEPEASGFVADAAVVFENLRGDAAFAETEQLIYIAASIGVCVDFVAAGNSIPMKIIEPAKRSMQLLGGGQEVGHDDSKHDDSNHIEEPERHAGQLRDIVSEIQSDINTDTNINAKD